MNVPIVAAWLERIGVFLLKRSLISAPSVGCPLDHRMQPPPHCCARCAERFTQTQEIAVAEDVVLLDQLRRHEHRSGKHVGLVLSGWDGRAPLQRFRFDRSRAAEYGAIGVPVEAPVPELVSDREASPSGPLTGFLGIDPDLAPGWEQ